MVGIKVSLHSIFKLAVKINLIMLESTCSLCQSIGMIALHFHDSHELEPSIKMWRQFRDNFTGHPIPEELTQSAKKYLEGVVSTLRTLITEAEGLPLQEKQALTRLWKLYQHRVQGYMDKHPSHVGNGRKRGHLKKKSVSSQVFTPTIHVYKASEMSLGAPSKSSYTTPASSKHITRCQRATLA